MEQVLKRFESAMERFDTAESVVTLSALMDRAEGSTRLFSEAKSAQELMLTYLTKHISHLDSFGSYLREIDKKIDDRFALMEERLTKMDAITAQAASATTVDAASVGFYLTKCTDLPRQIANCVRESFAERLHEVGNAPTKTPSSSKQNSKRSMALALSQMLREEVPTNDGVPEGKPTERPSDGEEADAVGELELSRTRRRTRTASALPDEGPRPKMRRRSAIPAKP